MSASGSIPCILFWTVIGVKMLRRQLEAEADSPTDIDQSNFRELLRVAAEKGLIDDVEA